MRNYFTNRNWFFDDYGKMLKDVGYHQQWSYKMYEHWTNNFNMKLYQENMKNVENFISSKDNFFSIKHKLLKIK